MKRTATDGGPAERKVQLAGGSTFTVSIPKGWAQERGITPGTGLFIYPFEDRLVVAPTEHAGADRRAVVDADAVDTGTLVRRIQAAYAAGADTIEIEAATGFSPEQRRAATTTVTGLVGMEVAEETTRSLVVRSLLDPAEISLQQTISQLRQLALPMHRDAVEAVTAGDAEFARRVAMRDDDVDRLFALVSRQFYRVLVDVREIDQLETDRLTAFTQFRIARQLERVADHAESIAEIADRQPAPPDGKTADGIESLAADARAVVTTALDGQPVAALDRRTAVVDALDEFDRTLYDDGDDGAYLHGRLVERIRRTAHNGGNIAEAVSLVDTVDGGS